MPGQITLDYLPRRDGYDWININREQAMVGKLRGLIDGDTFTVFSVMIFPEYASHGYGKEVIDRLKERFGVIIADRVRYKAIDFWEKNGFVNRGDGCHEYRRR